MATLTLMQTKDGRPFYKVAVSRGKGASKYTTRWYVPEGKSKRTIERELSKFVADFELKCSNGEVQTRSEKKAKEAAAAAEQAKIQTVQQYGERVFMPQLSVTCAENTRSSFQGVLNNHIYPAIGNVKMPAVTPEQITALLLSLQTEKHMKHASCVRVYTLLNLMFKQAYLSRMISPNPMDFVQRPKMPKSEGKDTELPSYTEQEVVYIMRCLDNEPFKWKCFVRLLIDTGCRRGEALALKWENVDFENCTITIVKSLNYTSQAGIYLDTPKSGKKRTVDVDVEVINLLRKLKAEQDKAVKIKDIGTDSLFVFTQDDYISPMHPQSPTHYFKQFSKRYGVPDFHPHKLRHTFASIAITNGADIASVSDKLGHADKGTTLRMYTHSDAEAQKRASNIFRNAIRDKQISNTEPVQLNSKEA